MKTIGLIGGMSWQSSKFYYEYLNEIVAEKLGGTHSAKILMSSVDFAEIEKLSFEDNWEFYTLSGKLELEKGTIISATSFLNRSNDDQSES